MRIPDSIKIGPHVLSISFQDTLPCDDGSENLGITKAYLNRILIARMADGEVVPESSLTDTFLHETIHACSMTFGLGLSERQISGLAGALLAVIRDNGLDFRETPVEPNDRLH